MLMSHLMLACEMLWVFGVWVGSLDLGVCEMMPDVDCSFPIPKKRTSLYQRNLRRVTCSY
jgi:hypothetical protein